jgi:predicted MFS family arabinose efflux permease
MHPSTSPAAPSGPTDSTDGSPPSVARNWLAVGSIAVGTFAMVTTEFLPVGLLTDIAADLQVSVGHAGLMVTLPGLAAAVAGPTLIVASGRLDRRLVMLTLTALLLLVNLVGALAPSFGVMLAARVLLGICVGGFWTFAPGIGTQLVPAASQARAMAIILAGISVGSVAGVPAGALLGSLAGWRSAFASTAVLAALVLLAQWWLLPALPAARALRAADLRKPLRLRMAKVGLVAIAFLILGHFAAYTYLKPLLETIFGLEPTTVAVLLLLYGVIGLAGNLIGGQLVAWNLRWALVFPAMLLGSALLLAAFSGPGALSADLVVAAWGLAFGALPVALTAWMIQAVPDAPDAGQAVLVSVFQIALASGALLGGLAVDGYGVPSAMLLGAAMAWVAAGVLGLFGRQAR